MIVRPTLLMLACLGLAVPSTAQRRPQRATDDAFSKLLRQYDKNRDGQIQRDEYPRTETGFKNLDRDGNGVVEAADFTAPRARQRPQPAGADRPAKLPKVGDDAPDFELPMLGMKDTKVKLSSFRGDRPVALIFGSYT
jgi:hypothetical protein